MKIRYIPFTAALCVLCLLCGCSQTDTAPTETVGTADTVVNIATTQYFTDEAVSDADVETILNAGINAPSAMNGQPWHFSVITDSTVLEQISSDMSGGRPFGGAPAGRPEGFAPPKMDGDAPTKLPEGFTLPEMDGDMPAELPEGFTPPEMDGDMPTERPEGFTPPEMDGNAPPAGMGSGANKAGLTDAPLAIVISCKNGSELDAGLACQNMSAAAQLLGYGTKILSSPTMALNGEKQEEYRELLGIPADQSAVAVLLIGKEDTSVDESIDGYTGASERDPFEEMVTYVNGK